MPLLLVIHICYQKVNDGIHYPADIELFLALEAKSGHWQIEVDYSDSGKTALTSYHGL